MGQPLERNIKLIYMTIGFIGQGWIGRNYADDFEKRGHAVVRYALEPEYSANGEKIRHCDIVFIAVPTPTTPAGFDASIVRSALSLVGPGNVAVIKSTVVPGTAARLQAEYPDAVVLYSPEFLSEATAAHDAANPFSNIIGLTVDDEPHRAAADKVLAVLPKAPFAHVCTSTEAELIKYAHNLNGYFQIQLSNILYDAAQALGASWQNVEPAIAADPFISNRYSKPVHKTGRGAGGGCFIKDFAAFREMYVALMPDDARGKEMLAALEQKNIDLLKKSGKDSELLRGVYGEDI
jgi:UDPglucose 6-dehydrogenase